MCIYYDDAYIWRKLVFSTLHQAKPYVILIETGHGRLRLISIYYSGKNAGVCTTRIYT